MPVATQNARAGPSRHPNRQDLSQQQDGSDDERLQKPQVLVEEGWTIETFTDLPVVKTQPTLAFIAGLVGKCRELITRIEEGMEKATEAATLIEEASPDHEMLEQFETEFRRGIERKQQMLIKIQVLESLHMQLRQNQDLENPVGVYKRDTAAREREYLGKTLRQKFKDDPDYINFRTSIWEVNHEGTAGPPTTAYLPREDGDGSDDEEIEVGMQTQNFRCPITLRPYVDAVTCVDCKHSYSKDAIMSILSNTRKRSVKCPFSGCSTAVTAAKLQPDKELQRKTDAFVRRQAEREAREAEDEED